MSTQISILNILRTSPSYKEILDSDLQESHVPTNINATKFINLVGHISTSCVLSFKPFDVPKIEPDHILPLYIYVMVSNSSIKRVMIDHGSALNPCTLRLFKQEGYTEEDIINEVITIKAYDNLDRTTKGTILLPIKFGPTT